MAMKSTSTCLASWTGALINESEGNVTKAPGAILAKHERAGWGPIDNFETVNEGILT